MRSLFALILSTLAMQAVAMPVTWTANGHEYQLVYFQGTWAQADALQTNGWHLATITSQAEQDFVSSTFANHRGEFWLGGYQGLQTDSERINQPDANWHWVTGEAWNYTNWRINEPNEWRGRLEDHLGIWNNGGGWRWHWNDEHGRSNIRGYIAERSVPVPAASTLALILLGIAALFLQRRLRLSAARTSAAA